PVVCRPAELFDSRYRLTVTPPCGGLPAKSWNTVPVMTADGTTRSSRASIRGVHRGRLMRMGDRRLDARNRRFPELMPMRGELLLRNSGFGADRNRGRGRPVEQRTCGVADHTTRTDNDLQCLAAGSWRRTDWQSVGVGGTDRQSALHDETLPLQRTTR